MVGALLRRPLHHVRTRIVAAHESAGMEAISATHLNVFQHPGPEGLRPTDLARRADMTKQSMNHLLSEPEGAGYIERRTARRDGREKEVWLTPRGADAVQVIRQAVGDIEREWQDLLGESRYRTFRESLILLNSPQ